MSVTVLVLGPIVKIGLILYALPKRCGRFGAR